MTKVTPDGVGCGKVGIINIDHGRMTETLHRFFTAATMTEGDDERKALLFYSFAGKF